MSNDFQYRLLKVIGEKGITAAELSRATGLSSCAISNYVNGKYLPKQDKVYLLAKALDVDPGWLITGVEPTKPPEEAEVPQTSEARILAAGIDKLPKDQREQALSVVRAMFAKYSSYFEEDQSDET